MDPIEKVVEYEYTRAQRPGLAGWVKRFAKPRSSQLVDFNTVRSYLSFAGQHDAGLKDVPIRSIVGSVGRAADFDRQFHPRQEANQHRWKGIARAVYQGRSLPPVELLKVGELYFVVDGHHRISVFQQQGMDYIDAHIIELETGEDIRSTTELRQIISGDSPQRS